MLDSSNNLYQNELVRIGFFQNRNKNGNDYNYDLSSLINNFDFCDFIDYAEKYKHELKDYGAFTVITDIQSIIGYNARFCQGTHPSSFARALKDLKGGGPIINSDEANQLTKECIDNYITGRIMYERCESYGRPKCSGHISFNLVGKTVTENQLRVFEKFKDDYGLEIKRIIKKYGMSKFKIIITFINEFGVLDSLETDNLDDVYVELLRIAIFNREQQPENIIGVDCRNKKMILS
jgi:hypothetical protein